MKRKKFSPADLVAALLFYSDIARMTSDSTPLHRALFLIRGDPLLRDFNFQTIRDCPQFPDLNLALANLQLTHLIEVSADLEEYCLDETGRDHIERYILPLFTEDERDSLSRLAGDLRLIVAAFTSETGVRRTVFREPDTAVASPIPARVA